jgi:hypothetical protein
MTTEAAGLGLTEVLMRHRFRGAGEGYSPAVCDCGDWNPRYSRYSVAAEVEYAHHVAEEVHTWLRAALTSPEVVEAAERAIHSTAACAHMDDLVPYCDRCDAAAVLAAAAETLGAK